MEFGATPLGWTLLTVLGIALVFGGVLVSLAFLLYADRKDPRNGYFELDAQPPMMMP